jgi:glucose 1-dehydrogenase
MTLTKFLIMEQKLRGQVALITGAGSGIGSGIAHAMAAEGATVVINYPSEKLRQDAIAVQRDIEKHGGQAVICQADVGVEKEVIEMFDTIIKNWGTIDILVNNAGIQRDAPFPEMSLSQWNHVIKTNLTGQFLCSREAVKEFLRRGIVPEKSCAAGKIICISSVHEVIPWSGHVNYAASKGGVMLLMKSLAQEMAPHKIRVNSISPGAIKTRINYEAWSTEEAEEKLLKLIPYGRVGDVSDIGKAAVWLASDESDYMNGASLYVDGGMTLYPGFSTSG